MLIIHKLTSFSCALRFSDEECSVDGDAGSGSSVDVIGDSGAGGTSSGIEDCGSVRGSLFTMRNKTKHMDIETAQQLVAYTLFSNDIHTHKINNDLVSDTILNASHIEHACRVVATDSSVIRLDSQLNVSVCCRDIWVYASVLNAEVNSH